MGCRCRILLFCTEQELQEQSALSITTHEKEVNNADGKTKQKPMHSSTHNHVISLSTIKKRGGQPEESDETPQQQHIEGSYTHMISVETL